MSARAPAAASSIAGASGAFGCASNCGGCATAGVLARYWRCQSFRAVVKGQGVTSKYQKTNPVAVLETVAWITQTALGLCHASLSFCRQLMLTVVQDSKVQRRYKSG